VLKGAAMTAIQTDKEFKQYWADISHRSLRLTTLEAQTTEPCAICGLKVDVWLLKTSLASCCE
jgi:hypothetical protein